MKKKFTPGLFVLSAICGVLLSYGAVFAQTEPTDNSTAPAAPEAANSRLFVGYLNGVNEVPTNSSAGTGFGRVVLNAAETQITVSFYWTGLETNTAAGHIHGPALAGVNAPVLFNMAPATGATSGTKEDVVFNVTAAQVVELRGGLYYFNIHTTARGGGEIRAQIRAASAKADYDGDGKSDYGVVRSGSGGNPAQLAWFIKNNGGTNDVRRDWGLTTDVLSPADYDGDGKEDIAVWRQSPAPATFYVLKSSDSTFQFARFGISGDLPISRDYTGDGKADPAVYRAGNPGNFWYLPSSGPFAGKPVEVLFGATGDYPVPGDFNGDGKADFCVVHNTGGIATFNIRYGTDAVAAGPADTTSYFGRFTTDSAVQGDFDGDGKADIAVTRPEGGQIVWYVLPSSGGPFQRGVWGVPPGDFQVPGDYDGDGRTDFAIWRPSGTAGSTAFYVLGSQAGFLFQQWGNGNTDTPVNFDVLQ